MFCGVLCDTKNPRFVSFVGLKLCLDFVVLTPSAGAPSSLFFLATLSKAFFHSYFFNALLQRLHLVSCFFFPYFFVMFFWFCFLLSRLLMSFGDIPPFCLCAASRSSFLPRLISRH